MTQTTLTGGESGSGDESDDQTSAEAESTSATSSPSAAITSTSEDGSNGYARLAPPEQRGGDSCCPWCLASTETFVEHDDGSVGCGHCSASIPVGMEWYERGEKIVVGPNREI
jgi:hypothetical protein